MRAVATDGRRGLEVVEVAAPDLPPDGALVRVRACGLCGSDLEKIRSADTPAGRVLGHEVVGLLERSDHPPHRVALAHHVPCGRCPRCRAGHSSLCEQFLSTELAPGGFAEQLAVGPLHLANAVFPLPADVDDLTATLLEPLSCVLRALEAAVGLAAGYPAPDVHGAEEEVRPGHGAGLLVAGCGMIGLLFISVLTGLRAHTPAQMEHLRPLAEMPIRFLEPRPERARLARGLGALAAEAGSEAPEVAFLTAPAALGATLTSLAAGGVLVVFAAPGRPVSLDLDEVYRRELTLAGVRSGSPRHLRQALDLLAGGRLPLSWLEPEVVSFGGLAEATERYERGQVLKVVLRP
jgi:L-iditol 2-dehydrogenase